MTEEHGADAADAPLPLPQLGHYQALEQIGQGGMATVYKGIQPSLNRTVAIKVLPERFARTPELLERFDREANIASQLNHPNIVQVIDRGKEGDTLFIVMEYVDGESLDKLIQRQALTVPMIMDYAMQICDALEFAHEKGVVHRDLKPSNILVDRQTGRAKIADFGIAQFETTGSGLSTLTSEHSALGTMNYMSPEQRLDSHKVTYLTDIFSLGVVLYEMLVGKLPIGHFKLPSLVRHDIPMGFDNVVKKCLAESPSDRYQNAAEIKADLGRMTGRHLRITKTGLVVKVSPWVGKRRYMLAGGALLGVGLIALIVGLLMRPSAEPPVPPPATSVAVASTVLPTLPAGDEEKAKGLLDGARGLVREKRRPEAIEALKELLQKYPRSTSAPDAQFALAAAYDDANELGTAWYEYDNLIQRYPKSPHVPDAVFARCLIAHKTLPTHGVLSKSWEGDPQRKLVQSLRQFATDYPANPNVSKALHLAADVSQKADMSDYGVAADCLMQLYALEQPPSAGLLYQAAEMYDKKGSDKAKTIAAYSQFVNDFPDDPRAALAGKRLKALQK